MLSKSAKIFIFIFLIAMIGVAFGFGFWYGQSKVICPVCPPEDLDFSLFWETWQTIQEKYVDKDVFLIVTYDTSVGLYGRVIDIVIINGKVKLVLDTNYSFRRLLMILNIEDISYIRERKDYE